MADVVFIAVVIGFVALAWLLVQACDRLLGPDEAGLATGPPTAGTTPAPPPEPTPGAGGAVATGGPR